MALTTARVGVLGALLAGLAIALPTAAFAGTPPPASDHATAVSSPSAVGTTAVFGSVTPNAALTRGPASTTAEAKPTCFTCVEVGPSPQILPSPFVFTYAFDHHLAIGGGYFTVGQPVVVRVVRDDGVRELNRRVVARTHPITPGGAVYLHTDMADSTTCGFSRPNGYVQAYDTSSQRWSARTRVAICHFIDGTGDFGNHPADD